ncbi:sensor histidine kinase [Shewanella youngdeokensis]|uniref:histidine kinase n=1 Tax=Shewanella youngdeokensis TaxID=2999068 RepID=A0ABZ0JWL4_9GAMM|nr:HAMP domain-containing sensor histidine kinase [Shewanella sp. DAU334]
MLDSLLNKVPTASSLPHKLMLYFSTVAVMIGVTIYFSMFALMQWVEDEVNQHELKSSASYAVKQFKQGATEPLAIGLRIKAYHSADLIPEKYGDLSHFPIGFIGESVGDNQLNWSEELKALLQFTPDAKANLHEVFLYRGSFHHNHKLQPLYLIMESDNVELSEHKWNLINLFIISFICVLFLLFGLAIHKLSCRLVRPVSELSQQLKSIKPNKTFCVSKQSAAEFTELAESLNHYRQQNEMMIKQEQAFARYASHELRTPLTVISGAAKLQEKNNAVDFQTRQRDRIQRAALDMQHTIDVLLNLVKQEKATDSNHSRLLTLAEIEHIVQPLQTEAKRKNINININIEQAPVIKPAPTVLKMLLSNVISNAINASEAGDITVLINQHEIVVTDQGQGLTESEQGNMHGHGLGLLIVNSLCQRYQWQFNLTNAQPTGCVARLSFPALSL